MGKINYRIFPDCKTVHFIGEGEISFSYLMESVGRVHQDPQFDFSYNSFIDFADAYITPNDPGQRDYISWFSRLQKSTNTRRWAIYTLNPATIASANLTHMLVARGIEVGVFTHLGDALDYLEISPEQIELPSERLKQEGASGK